MKNIKTILLGASMLMSLNSIATQYNSYDELPAKAKRRAIKCATVVPEYQGITPEQVARNFGWIVGEAIPKNDAEARERLRTAAAAARTAAAAVAAAAQPVAGAPGSTRSALRSASAESDSEDDAQAGAGAPGSSRSSVASGAGAPGSARTAAGGRTPGSSRHSAATGRPTLASRLAAEAAEPDSHESGYSVARLPSDLEGIILDLDAGNPIKIWMGSNSITMDDLGKAYGKLTGSDKDKREKLAQVLNAFAAASGTEGFLEDMLNACACLEGAAAAAAAPADETPAAAAGNGTKPTWATVVAPPEGAAAGAAAAPAASPAAAAAAPAPAPADETPAASEGGADGAAVGDRTPKGKGK